MNHIPHTLNSEIPHIEIPLVAGLEYELGSFETFWVKHGFENDQGSFALGQSTQEYASLIQSWLLAVLWTSFGILASGSGSSRAAPSTR